MKSKNVWSRRILSVLLSAALLLSLIPASVSAVGTSDTVQAEKLRVNYLDIPMGIDDAAPDFSWIMTASARSQVQTAYRILVATSPDLLEENKADMWDSGKVDSDQSNNVEYAGKPLNSKTRYYWAVRVWDKDGVASDYSEPAYFETAMLSEEDWTAQWISTEEYKPILSPVVIEFDEPVEAQYVKLNVTKIGIPVDEQNWWRIQLAEFEVYGPENPDKNLALGCNVTADNSMSNEGAWAPQNLTDGKQTSEGSSYGFTTNQYVGTNIVDPPVNIEIDLGQNTLVNKVILYSRTDVSSKEDPNLAGSFPEDYTVQTRTADGEYAVQKDIVGQPTPSMPQQNEKASGLPVFGTSFTLDKEIESARAYVSGLGYYEMTVNGQQVTDKVLEPGESAYDKTVLYATYDITDLLQEGENAVGAMLGKGLYNCPSTPGRYQKLTVEYGPLQFLAQIEVKYTDGTTKVINTDETWKVTAGPITFSDWYGGEDYDANRELGAWDEPGYTYDGWDNAQICNAAKGELKAQFYPSTKVMEEWKAVDVTNPSEGVYVIDFGRNYAGVYEIAMSAPQGTEVQFWPSELLNADGTVNQGSTGGPTWDTYTFKGEGVETWSPKFVYHGFRYLEVRGLPFEPTPDMFTAKLIRASNEKIGEFDTSSEILNQIDVIINRSIEANMYNTLTDCPHREKLGWLEVPQLLYNSIAPNYDVSAWMTKISHDTIDSQTEDGLVPDISPEYTVFAGGFRDDPTWGGACIMIPYQTYTTYGNIAPLKESYDTMVRYMDYLAGKSDGYLLNHGLGDWGGYDTSTSVGFTVSCTYYSLATAMNEIAALLEKDEDAAKYAELAANIRNAVNTTYYHEDEMSYDSGSQGANAMALYYGICEEENKEGVLNSLVASVEAAGNHLTTGEISLKPLFLALGENGRNDVVYAMASNKTMPSYWYFIEQGATSLPEFWDMAASQMHCMMGHLESWLYEQLAGIRNEGIAYKHMTIDPYFPGDLDYIDIATQSSYGRVASAWNRNGDGTVTMNIEVPANTTATIYLPSNDVSTITESGVALADQKDGIVSYTVEGTETKVEVGSGSYEFVCNAPVSFDSLQQAITEAKKIRESNVISGWDELQAAIAEAEALMNNEEATQVEVDEMTAKLLAVVDAVVVKNLALDKTVIFSSSYQDGAGWDSANLTDGDRLNDYPLPNGNGGWSSSNFDEISPQWCGVDFGKETEFNRVLMVPRPFEKWDSDVSKSFASQFDIQISNDGETWITVASYENYEQPKNYEPQIFDVGTQKARYVRFYGAVIDPEGGSLLQIAEMEVYNVTDYAQAPAEVTVNETFEVTVTASKNVERVRLFNENGMAIGSKVKDVQLTDDGEKVFTLELSVGTVGNGRTLTAYAQRTGQPLEKLSSVTLDVLSVAPSAYSFTAPESVVANAPIEMTVVTSTDTARVKVYNEYGLSMGISKASYEDVGGQRVWTLTTKIGTVGIGRQYTAVAVNKYGAVSQAIESNLINVRAF